MREARDFFDINQNNWRISLQLRSTDSFSHRVVIVEGEGEVEVVVSLTAKINSSRHDTTTKTIPYKFIIFTI